MSLEANLSELTKAINALVNILNNAHTAPLVVQCAENRPAPQADAAEPGKRGPARPRKDGQAPAAAPVPGPAPAPAPLDMGPANEGDPEGTTYWLSEKHNSAYRIVPGDGTPGPLAGSVQISGAAFLTKQAEFVQKFADLGNAPTPLAPAAVPTTAASTPTAAAAAADAQPSKGATYEQARAALLNLVKAKANGRELVMGILTQHAANSVPELASKGAAVFDAVVSEVQRLGVAV
jgi:hypothetical protein